VRVTVMFQCRARRAVVSATVAAQARWASLGDSSRLKKQRARAAGTHMGRPPKTTEAQRQIIRARLVKGETVTAVARDFKVSRATVLTVRDNARP